MQGFFKRKTRNIGMTILCLRIMLFLTILFCSHGIYAQGEPREICGTTELFKRLLETDPNYGKTRIEIEDFTKSYEALINTGVATRRTSVVAIPVVVHVVYNTNEQNITDDQIRSQIDVLNEDFRKLNADVSLVPTAFQPFVADARIEFGLAQRDTNCNPTNGITRTQTNVIEFAFPPNNIQSVHFTSKGGKDAWPKDEYLNLWVCNIERVRGYATFPANPTELLPPELKDGVVIDYRYFGNRGTSQDPKYGFGRVATHEIGHWLNLRHIWGRGCRKSEEGPSTVCEDGSDCCSIDNDDEVSDTPKQECATIGCPTFPQNSCNNGPNGNMFMNFMDYTDHACMHMFTIEQSIRMDVILDGVRQSLQNSKGLIPPKFKINDRVQVTNTGVEQLRIRKKAGIDCGANRCVSNPLCGETCVECTAPDGSTGKIVAGCVVENGYTWWKIQWDTGTGDCVDGMAGWSVEGSKDGGVYYLEKKQTPSATITSAVPLPSAVASGDTFTITYNIQSSDFVEVILGASIYSTATGPINDPLNDTKVNIPPLSPNRNFKVPTNTPQGIYELWVALWLDNDNNNGINNPPDTYLDLKKFPNAITVTSTPTTTSTSISTTSSTTSTTTPPPLTGSITMTINPQGAVNDGAQWKLTTESTWHNSGTTKHNVPYSNQMYMVEFKTIPLWITPPNKKVTVNASQPNPSTNSPLYTRITTTTSTTTTTVPTTTTTVPVTTTTVVSTTSTSTTTTTNTPTTTVPCQWNLETVDSIGDVGAGNSLAFDASGNPAISYVARHPDFDLRFAHFNGISWVKTIFDGETVSGETSLAFDALGHPGIAYDISGNLKYAHFNGTSWVKNAVALIGNVVSTHKSLAFDASGNPAISYYDATDNTLKYAHDINGDGDFTDPGEIILVASQPTGVVGWYNSLAFDASGNPAISYSGNWPDESLRFARFNGISWVKANVDPVAVDGYTSLAFDGFGNPAISYFDGVNSDLKYAHFNGTSWGTAIVDSEGLVGYNTSLAFDASGFPAISYWAFSGSALKYAHFNGTSWGTKIVDSVGEVGFFNSLAFDSQGNPTISYYDFTNGDLKYARFVPCATTTTTTTTSSTTSTTTTTSSTTFSTVTTTTTSTTPTTCHLTIFCRDDDEDGYGNPHDTILTCAGFQGPDYVLDCSDCDDANLTINPGAGEICNDRVDNNCDGLADCNDPGCWPPCSGTTTTTVTSTSTSTTTTLPPNTFAFAIQPGLEGKDTYYGTVFDTNGKPDAEKLSCGGWGDWYYDFFEFDLAGSPSSMDTVSATLYLYGSTPNDPALQVHRITENWTEAGVTRTSNPTSLPYKKFGSFAVGTDAWNEVDITDLYKGWKDGTYPNFGIKLVPTNNNHTNGSIASSDNTNGAIRPKLEIVYKTVSSSTSTTTTSSTTTTTTSSTTSSTTTSTTTTTIIVIPTTTTTTSTTTTTCFVVPIEIFCTNGVDDDCDGLVDCADPDCSMTSEVCNDNIDNDCDGLVDCNDLDCQIIDADGDGFYALPCGNDCNDNDLNVNPGATEICNNNIDNDCDTLVGCTDAEDCFGKEGPVGINCPPGLPCQDSTVVNYSRGRSYIKFNKRLSKDRAYLRLCVNQEFCNALTGNTEDIVVELIGCDDTMTIFGSSLTPTKSGFRAKSSNYIFKINCKKLWLKVRMKKLNLNACLTETEPFNVKTCVSITNDTCLCAEGEFEDKKKKGRIKKLLLQVTESCAP